MKPPKFNAQNDRKFIRSMKSTFSPFQYLQWKNGILTNFYTQSPWTEGKSAASKAKDGFSFLEVMNAPKTLSYNKTDTHN